MFVIHRLFQYNHVLFDHVQQMTASLCCIDMIWGEIWESPFVNSKLQTTSRQCGLANDHNLLLLHLGMPRSYIIARSAWENKERYF